MMEGLNILLVLLLVCAVLVLAWKLEEASSKASYQKGRADVLDQTVKDVVRWLEEEANRNESLVDRMGRMQREGFVDLTWDEGEMGGDPTRFGEGGDTSGSGGLRYTLVDEVEPYDLEKARHRQQYREMGAIPVDQPDGWREDGFGRPA